MGIAKVQECVVLPLKYFERLVKVANLRTAMRPSERRGKPRLPVYMKCKLHLLSPSNVAGKIEVVRVKDLSESGISLLVPRSMALSKTVVIGIQPPNYETHWLQCQLRRIVQLDGISRLAGASFEKLLYPGQCVAVGTSLNGLLWLDVNDKGNPPDPYDEAGSQNNLELSMN